MANGMTTLLDAVCSNCVTAKSDLPQLSAFSALPDSTEPIASTKAPDLEYDDEDAPCSQFSPSSFRNQNKDAFSPGSSELPSMPSEKSNSRGCSTEGSSGYFPISNEVTDTERSTSDCSMSPCGQRLEPSTCVGLVSPALVRLEDAVDSVLDQLHYPGYQDVPTHSTPISCSPPPKSHASSISQPVCPSVLPATDSQPATSKDQMSSAFTSHVSYSSTLYTQSSQLFPENGAQQQGSISKCGYFRDHEGSFVYPAVTRHSSYYGNEMYLSHYPTYQNRPTPYDRKPTSEVVRHSYESSNHGPFSLRSPQHYPFRVKDPLDGDLGNRTVSPYSSVRSLDHPNYSYLCDQARVHGYDEHQQCHSVHASQRYVNCCKIQGNVRQPIVQQCEQSDCFNHERKSPASFFDPYIPCCRGNNTSALPLTDHSELINRRRGQDYQKPQSGSSVISAVVCSSVSIPPPNRTPANLTCENSLSVSQPKTSTVSHELLSVVSQSRPANCVNRFGTLDVRRADLPGEGAGRINQLIRSGESHVKRRSQQTVLPSRPTKRRRPVDAKDVHKSASSLASNASTLTENLIKSVFLNDATQYLQDPVISLPVTLCSPSPVPRSYSSPRNFQKISSIQSESNGDISLTNRAQKYFHFPLFLHESRRDSPGDESLLNLIIRATNEDDSSGKLLHENFLLSALKRASVRSAQSFTYTTPSTPERKTSTSETLLDYLPSCSTDSIGRITPPLFPRRPSTLTNISSPKTTKMSYPQSQRLVPSCTELIIRSESLTNTQPAICSHCSMQIMMLQNAIRWRLPDGDGHLMFCSSLCLSAYQRSLVTNETKRNSLPSNGFIPTFNVSLLSDSNESLVLLQGCCLPKNPKSVAKRLLSQDHKPGRRRHSSEFLSHDNEGFSCHRAFWRWNRSRWRRYSSANFPLKQLRLHHSEDLGSPASTNDGKSTRGSGILHSPAVDRRVCILCHKPGDAPNDVAGRLLNYDFDVWLHLNCILWCYDTYETVSGSLVHVQRSLQKAQKTMCTHCHLTGAGLPCFHSDCKFIYHLPCAYAIGCSFYADRSMYCPVHCDTESKFAKLTSLRVDRRVFTCRDESEQVGDAILHVNQLNDTSAFRAPGDLARLRVGGLILHEIGQLLPEQLTSGLFHNSNFIYPVGFSSTRIYWSYRHVKRRCRYKCRIGESLPATSSNKDGAPIGRAKFIVEVHEVGEPSESFEDATCNGVWQKILTRINRTRQLNGRKYLRVFQNHILGEVLYGLTEPHIIRAIESLPGVDRLNNYAFKFGRLQLIKEMPLAVNPTGCARSEPKLRTHVRRRTIVDTSDSDEAVLTHKLPTARYTCTPLRSNLGSPVYSLSHSSTGASKSQQYRRLRAEWRVNVILARSKIQGLGLYAARDITKHSFIIEYLGELIRNEVGNRREQLYESQNRGVYMFRVDDDCIVDATMCGGLARYINHSCEPNCTAEVLNCDNGSHIIIIANRNIEKGEELTYDYKFDIEEDRWDRIPCLCGAPNCRKWMN